MFYFFQNCVHFRLNHALTSVPTTVQTTVPTKEPSISPTDFPTVYLTTSNPTDIPFNTPNVTNVSESAFSSTTNLYIANVTTHFSRISSSSSAVPSESSYSDIPMTTQTSSSSDQSPSLALLGLSLTATVVSLVVLSMIVIATICIIVTCVKKYKHLAPAKNNENTMVNVQPRADSNNDKSENINVSNVQNPTDVGILGSGEALVGDNTNGNIQLTPSEGDNVEIHFENESFDSESLYDPQPQTKNISAGGGDELQVEINNANSKINHSKTDIDANMGIQIEGLDLNDINDTRRQLDTNNLGQ